MGHRQPGSVDRALQDPPIVIPSGEISIDSMATSFPPDSRSVPLIFVGHAFATVRTIVGVPVSSRRLIVIGDRSIEFIFIRLNQSQNGLSDLNTPFFMMMLPCFLIPGIFETEDSGLSPWRYSMGWASTSRPETSWKESTSQSHST